jgi:hypothetical protein
MANNKDYPNILFISSNAFSTKNANGRVMEQLVHYLPDDNLSMIYFTGVDPDTKEGCTYLKITDREKLKYFFKKRNLGQFVKASNTKKQINKNSGGNGTHNGLSLLLREFVWKHGKWDRTNVDNLIKNKQPDIIFLNASRNIFVIDLALYVNKKFNLPIVLYTTEDEYFHHPSIFNLFNFIFYSKLRKEYKKLYKYVSETIVFHDGLKLLYDKEFNINSIVIHMSTTIDDKAVQKNKNVFTYAGNIDRGRDKTLLYIANGLKQISNDYKLRIISPSTKHINKKLLKMDNVILTNFMPYKEFLAAINSSPIVFNIESFRKKDKELIRSTFSCKTADLLASNSPVLVIGPLYCYCVNYFTSKKDSVFVASKQEDIIPTLKNMILHYDELNSYVDNAHKLVDLEFNEKKNSEIFLDVINKALNKAN